MKLALVGGTGTFGRGLAIRFATNNDVLVGSRNPVRAANIAAEVSKLVGRPVIGDANITVAEECDVAILTVPGVLGPGFLEELADPLAGKLVISPIVPMGNSDGNFIHALPSGSAAERVAARLPRSSMAAALHTLPAATLADYERKLDFDVPICADDRQSYEECSRVITGVEGLRPLYAGPLSSARELESLTPLILNVARFNHLRRLSIKFVS